MWEGPELYMETSSHPHKHTRESFEHQIKQTELLEVKLTSYIQNHPGTWHLAALLGSLWSHHAHAQVLEKTNGFHMKQSVWN